MFVHLYSCLFEMVWMDHVEISSDYFHVAQKIVKDKGCTKRGNGIREKFRLFLLAFKFIGTLG